MLKLALRYELNIISMMIFYSFLIVVELEPKLPFSRGSFVPGQVDRIYGGDQHGLNQCVELAERGGKSIC